MLCDRVLWNLEKTADSRRRQRIAVPFTWLECRTRIARKPLPDGTTLRLILSPGAHLSHGDVLHEDEAKVIWVDVQPARLLVGVSDDAETIARISYGLGNLHLPVEITGHRIRTLADGPAYAVFRQYDLEPIEQTDRFEPLPLPNGVGFSFAPDCVI